MKKLFYSYLAGRGAHVYGSESALAAALAAEPRPIYQGCMGINQGTWPDYKKRMERRGFTFEKFHPAKP